VGRDARQIEYDVGSARTLEREEHESVNEEPPSGEAALPEIGFYYPNQFWYSGDWIKNLILFFDGVGLLVPDYMQDRLEQSDPAIVGGLRDHGLLHVLEPATVVDKDAAEQLAAAMAEVISSGALDDLGGRNTAFAELSMSRLGFRGDADLSRMIVEELETRELARKVRQFVREVGPLPEEQRPEAFQDRQEELDDLARDLKRASRQAWKRPASFALTVAGAAWTAATGDPLGAILGGGAGLAGMASRVGSDAGAYSYLFRAARNYA